MKYLLDTNIVLNWVRKSPDFDKLNEKYDFFDADNDTFISIVSVGEMYAIARRLNWGEKKRMALTECIKALSPQPIEGEEIIEVYGMLDAYSQGKLEDQPLPEGISARNMGKNDLWIAATAYIKRATLVTLDKDFEHLNEIFIEVVGI